MKVLVILNAIAACVHLLGGIAIAALNSSVFTFTFLVTRQTTIANSLVVVKLWSGEFWPWVAAFPLLTAVAHGVVLVLAYFGVYRTWMERCVNPLRWIEYSVTATIMTVQIAFLCRVSDVYVLSLMALSMVLCNLTGLLTELRGSRATAPLESGTGLSASLLYGRSSIEALEDTKWRNPGYTLSFDYTFLALQGVGTVLFLMSWTPIWITFAQNASQAPNFVWAIVVGLTVLFCSFPINQWAVECGYVRYSTGEGVYQVLSLVSKTLLWALLAGGGLRNDAFPNVLPAP